MGVERTHYIMLGVKFPFNIIDHDNLLDDGYYEKYEVYEDNGYEEEITEHCGLTMVSDGMNGEYIFIGKVIQKKLDHEGFKPTDCLQFSQNEMKLLEHLIKSKFEEEAKDMDIKVSVWVFTHWH